MKKGAMGWGPFRLPENHPFNLGAELLHDPAYQAYLDGFGTYEDLIKADQAYYSYMLAVAEELKYTDSTLTAQAEVFKAIIVMFRTVCRQYPGKAPMPPE